MLALSGRVTRAFFSLCIFFLLLSRWYRLSKEADVHCFAFVESCRLSLSLSVSVEFVYLLVFVLSLQCATEEETRGSCILGVDAGLPFLGQS